jgi:hypothetical protein
MVPGAGRDVFRYAPSFQCGRDAGPVKKECVDRGVIRVLDTTPAAGQLHQFGFALL